MEKLKEETVSGRMKHTAIRPEPGTYVDLRAEIDLLVAFSACPDLAVGGKAVRVTVYRA